MRSLLIVLAALSLTGCITDGANVPDLTPQPSADQLATPGATAAATAVDLPIAACKQHQVRHPARVGMNARIALKLTDHALSVANGHIINGNACIDQAASEYGHGLSSQ